MRVTGALVVVMALGSGARAEAPPRAPVAETRYEGPRLGFATPAGAQVKEATDIVADYALDVALPATAGLQPTTLRVLLSANKVADLDVEGVATAWRDARVRNRGSWGVKKKADGRAEVTHIGARRFVRLVDQMGSVLGASSQVMLCGSVSGRLACGIASTSKDDAAAAEAIVARMLETLVVKKR